MMKTPLLYWQLEVGGPIWPAEPGNRRRILAGRSSFRIITAYIAPVHHHTLLSDSHAIFFGVHGGTINGCNQVFV